MNTIRMNAPKAVAREAAGCDGAANDEKWDRFDRNSAHLYKFYIDLDPTTSWNKLDDAKKDDALWKMEAQCERDNVNVRRTNLAMWRVYNLHRSSMKTAQGSAAVKPSATTVEPASLPSPYDPVKEAARSAK